MGAIYQGGQMRVTIGTKTIMHEVDASFQSDLEFKEVASKDTASKLKTPGSINWSLSVNMLAAESDADAQNDLEFLVDAHKAKTLVTIEFVGTTTGDIGITGDAYIGSISIKATNEEEVTVDINFEGSGDYTKMVVA